MKAAAAVRYSSEVWTLGTRQANKLEAVHVKSLKLLLGLNRLEEQSKTSIGKKNYKYPTQLRDRGSTEVKALRYKSEGHWFDSRWCH